jgi:hypothetical protein
MTSNQISVGEIRESQAVAIGPRAQATLNQYTEIIVKVDTIDDLPPAPGEPPYKGLAYFSEQDRDIFFGREPLSDHLAGRLNDIRFLAVIGASGSGKSSLLRAGLIPRLRQRNWLIHLIKPGIHPLTGLAHSLTQDDGSLTAIKETHSALAADPDTLHLAGAKLVARGHAERLLLAVDQFEELLTQCKEPQERQAFINNLLCAVAANGPTTILISMRADFYDRITEFRALSALIAQQQELILPLDDESLVRVIAEPAKRGGWHFAQGLVEQIVEDVGREPGQLPLLSHALLETWNRRRGVVMTLGGYREAGGVEGAIARTAEETLAKLDASQKDVAREVFLNLTELGERKENSRRVAIRSELVANVDEMTLDSVLERLVVARLITVDKDEVEVAHEALIRRWPTLAQWLAEDREWLRFKRQIARDVAEWERSNRDPSLLYRGGRLAPIEEKLTELEPSLNELSQQFIQASLDAKAAEQQAEAERIQREEALRQERANAGRFRRLTQWLSGAVVFAIIATAVALFFMNTARTSEAEIQQLKRAIQARQLALLSEAETANDPETGLLLALAGAGANLQFFQGVGSSSPGSPHVGRLPKSVIQFGSLLNCHL